MNIFRKTQTASLLTKILIKKHFYTGYLKKKENNPRTLKCKNSKPKKKKKEGEKYMGNFKQILTA
jgi:hypothetical protein